MLDQYLLEEIIKSWKEKGDKVKSTITDEHFKLLLEIVFLTSLKREEGILIKIKVGLLQREKIQNVSFNNWNFITVFKKALPLSILTLSKVSMAFDPETTIIAISPSSKSKQALEIWGTTSIQKRMKKRLDPIPVYSLIYADLVISASSPGSLTITKRGDIVGRLIDGNFIKPKPSPFSSIALGGHLSKIIQSQQEYHKIQNNYWPLYRDFLEYLLVRALKQGRGGTIIWLPEKMVPSVINEIEIGYGVTESLNGTELLSKICELSKISASLKTESDQLLLNMTKRKVAEYIEYLAQLTNIDGALIINDNLSILSFGSKIKTETWNGNVLSGPQWPVDRPEDIDMSKYGTRHNSALRFVGKNSGSVAFVISQDGTITGLTKVEDNTVYYWKDLLSGLFDY